MKPIEKSGSHYLWTGPLDQRIRCMMEVRDRQDRQRHVMVYRPVWLDYWGVSLEQFGLDSRTLRLKRVCTTLRCVGPQHHILQQPNTAWEKYDIKRAKRSEIRKAFFKEGLAGGRGGAWWDAGKIETASFSPPHEVVVALASKLEVPNILILAAWSELVRKSLQMRGEWTRKDRAIKLYEQKNGVTIR